MTKKKPEAKKITDAKTLTTDPEIVPTIIEPEQQETTANDGGMVIKASNALIGGMSTELLEQGLKIQTEQRKLIKAFVQDHLEDGTDYGKIHVVSRDKCPDSYNCKKDYHYSKAVLFKPGQEKLFSLFQITGRLERDQETYDMLPGVQGLVAYKCVMYRGDQIVGEGRGSATVGESRRDANATIKIAEKRARMDACLSLGFSEYFAQDLDDPDYKTQADMANQRTAAEAERRDKDEFGLFPRDSALPINDQERATLYRLTVKAGFKGEEITDMLKLNGISDPAKMTSGEARDMMMRLKTNAFAAPPVVEKSTDIVITDIDDQDPGAALDAAEAAANAGDPEPEEPALVIDDDLKAYISDKVNNLGLNGQGSMWLYQKICGRPFAKFDKMTDPEWRRAYEIVQGMIEGTVDVPDRYIKGVITNPSPTDYTEPSNEAKKTEDALQATFPGAEPLA